MWAQTGPATLHGLTKLGAQLPPQAIENAGVRFTGIPRPQWKGINQGRHTGGRGDNHAFCRVLVEIMEKGCLAGTRLACEENIAAGVPNKIVG